MFGEERNRAFFGYGKLGVPGAVYQILQPPVLRIPNAMFESLFTGEYRKLADYHLWNALPFGRAARNVIPNAMNGDLIGIPEDLIGIDFSQSFGNVQDWFHDQNQFLEHAF